MKTLKIVALFVAISAVLAVGLFVYSFRYHLLGIHDLPLHKIHLMISDGDMRDGYRPFLVPSLKKVCLVSDGADLKGYDLPQSPYFYGYLAIVEYGEDAPKVGFAATKYIEHAFVLKDGFAYCTEKPGRIVVRNKGHYWMFEDAG